MKVELTDTELSFIICSLNLTLTEAIRKLGTSDNLGKTGRAMCEQEREAADKLLDKLETILR